MFGRKLVVSCISVLVLVIPAVQSRGYEAKEHEEMNRWILEHRAGGFDFDQYLRNNLGMGGGKDAKDFRSINFMSWLIFTERRTPEDLIARGGAEEDEPFWRCKHHFHDPLRPWEEAGYHFGVTNGSSSILWAQLETGGQSTWGMNGGDYSWHDAREYFHKALVGPDHDQRNRDLRRTFLAVGHLMHLIQDSSCPEHVRNDSHGLNKSVYELLLAKYHEGRIDGKETFFEDTLETTHDHSYHLLLSEFELGENLTENWVIPISRMVDTDQYTGSNPDKTTDPSIGLAEYTNVNFLSQGRIFKEYDFPNADSSVVQETYLITDPRDPGATIMREYVTKTGDGDTGYRLSTFPISGKYRFDLLDPIKIFRVSALDNDVLEDYAGRLVPRAVSYSARLLEYFFRGTIEVSLPDDGVYAFRDTEPADPRTQGFNRVCLLARNTTDTGERMQGGGIDLVVQYRLLTDGSNPDDPVACAKDPLTNESYQDLSRFHYSDPLYIVKHYPGSEEGEIIRPDAPVLLNFDLGDNEIPLWAVDVRFYVVYRGKLGKMGECVEEDAVCVGYEDVSEPTPIVFANSTDIFCYEETWWPGLDDDHNLQALRSRFDNNPCIRNMIPKDLLDLEIRFPPLGVSPVEEPYYTISVIEPGQYKRVYLITGQGTMLHYFSPTYAQEHCSTTGIDLRNGFINEADQATWLYPVFTEFRGVEIWAGNVVTLTCATCIEGHDCPECPVEAIDEDENFVPAGTPSAPE